jgi:hypothetical protein
MMLREQIKTELAQLDERIAHADPTHFAEVLQLRQWLRRRELLRAELKRLTAPKGATEENEHGL